jgi:hypothetical protein
MFIEATLFEVLLFIKLAYAVPFFKSSTKRGLFLCLTDC